jgi:hypothetical protein
MRYPRASDRCGTSIANHFAIRIQSETLLSLASLFRCGRSERRNRLISSAAHAIPRQNAGPVLRPRSTTVWVTGLEASVTPTASFKIKPRKTINRCIVLQKHVAFCRSSIRRFGDCKHERESTSKTLDNHRGYFLAVQSTNEF